MNNIFFASTNETCESNLHNLHLTVKSPRWWKFVHHSLKMCGEISTVGVYNRPGLYCTALACTVCQLAFSLHLFLYEQRCRLLLGALSSVLCLHLQTKNISYTLVKKKQTNIEANAHQVHRYESRHAPVARPKLPQSFSWSPHKICVVL